RNEPVFLGDREVRVLLGVVGCQKSLGLVERSRTAKMQVRVIESAQAHDFAVQLLEIGGFHEPNPFCRDFRKAPLAGARLPRRSEETIDPKALREKLGGIPFGALQAGCAPGLRSLKEFTGAADRCGERAAPLIGAG